MSNSKNEIKNPSSNPTLVLDTVRMDSANGTVVSEQGYFWFGVKLPKTLIFGGLGYIVGAVTALYGGEIGVFLIGVLGMLFYLFYLLRGSG